MINGVIMKKILFIAMLFTAIGANAQDQVVSTPKWYSNPPVSSKKFYGVGEGTSMSMDIAEKKAMLSANLQIAEQAEPASIKEIEKTSVSADGKIRKEKIQRKVVKAELTRVKVVKKTYIQNGDKYTVYVMLEMKKKR